MTLVESPKMVFKNNRLTLTVLFSLVFGIIARTGIAMIYVERTSAAVPTSKAPYLSTLRSYSEDIFLNKNDRLYSPTYVTQIENRWFLVD